MKMVKKTTAIRLMNMKKNKCRRAMLQVKDSNLIIYPIDLTSEMMIWKKGSLRITTSQEIVSLKLARKLKRSQTPSTTMTKDQYAWVKMATKKKNMLNKMNQLVNNKLMVDYLSPGRMIEREEHGTREFHYSPVLQVVLEPLHKLILIDGKI